MTSRDQGRTLGLEIYIISADYDSKILDRHRNTLIPDEAMNKVSNQSRAMQAQ